MVKNKGCTFQLALTTREQFIASIDSDPGNKFAKTFVSKANMLGLWPCLGCWEGDELLGAIAWSISKRQPYTANLQLLHTFAAYRRQGVAKLLCNAFLEQIHVQQKTQREVVYFRVSSEPVAREFYESLGIVFLGRQKSGCLLSIGRIEGGTFAEIAYSLDDPIILAKCSRKGKGGCVELFQCTNKKTPC